MASENLKISSENQGPEGIGALIFDIPLTFMIFFREKTHFNKNLRNSNNVIRHFGKPRFINRSNLQFKLWFDENFPQFEALIGYLAKKTSENVLNVIKTKTD